MYDLSMKPKSSLIETILFLIDSTSFNPKLCISSAEYLLVVNVELIKD